MSGVSSDFKLSAIGTSESHQIHLTIPADLAGLQSVRSWKKQFAEWLEDQAAVADIKKARKLQGDKPSAPAEEVWAKLGI